MMLDLLDYSGENKTHTVLKAVYVAAIAIRSTKRKYISKPRECPMCQGEEIYSKGDTHRWMNVSCHCGIKFDSRFCRRSPR